MRKRKDPNIRREVFIRVAMELFKEKGYEGISVRNVLTAVADKSASPSVFYYYFESKDDLYHACIETIADEYIEGLKNQFSIKYRTLEEWILYNNIFMKDYLIKYLTSNNCSYIDGSGMNYSFILNTRDKITQRVAEFWIESFSHMEDFPQCEAWSMARFLAGGISEIMYNYLLGEEKSEERVRQLVTNIIKLTVRAVGFSDEKREKIMNALEKGSVSLDD
ncbi:MAG: TetR/AcrR family transcriptional regulator [Lachnospiraceae bacterium]|nr:TetR/AcrR family transcriptional regulator [Lachnospiraceae bacterium]